MKRASAVLLLLPALIMVVAVQNAESKDHRLYSGRTTENRPIQILFSQGEMVSVEIEWFVPCEIATISSLQKTAAYPPEKVWEHRFASRGHFVLRGSDGKKIDFVVAIRGRQRSHRKWSGIFQARLVSGAADASDCRTGEIRWRAELRKGGQRTIE